MGKLACQCGHIILDQANNLPYKAFLIPDAHNDVLLEVILESIRSLREATNAGHREDWIKSHFIAPPYELTESDECIIFDIVSRTQWEVTQEVFECENCGRILIQAGKENQFKSFSPDSDDTKGILNGKKLIPGALGF